MEGERLRAYRRWYKELDARKAELESDGFEDVRTMKLLDGELRCLEELIALDSQLLLMLPDTLGPPQASDMDNMGARNMSTWPGDSGLPAVEGLDLSLVTDMLILSATSPWVVFVAERFKWNTVYVSPSAKRLLGWRQQELAGLPVHDKCHPDDVTTMLNMFNSNSSGNSLYYRRMRRDRSFVAVQGTGRILGQRWFAWMELLVAEAEPAYAGGGSPIKRLGSSSPPASVLSRLHTLSPPPDLPSIPSTALLPNHYSEKGPFPPQSQFTPIQSPSSHSTNELLPIRGGSIEHARQAYSAPLEDRKSGTHSLGGSFLGPSGGMAAAGPMEAVRRKGSRPTSPLSEDSEASLVSGKFNAQDGISLSRSAGTLGLSHSALARMFRPADGFRPSEGFRTEPLTAMNSVDRMRGPSKHSSLRGSGSSSSPSNPYSSLDNLPPLVPSDSKLFARLGAQNDPHLSPPSQPHSRVGSGSSSGGKLVAANSIKVGGPEYGFAAGGVDKEGEVIRGLTGYGPAGDKEGELMRASAEQDSVLNAADFVGTPLFKEASTADLDEPERWRPGPQLEESNSDVSQSGLSASILMPVSAGGSPKLGPLGSPSPSPPVTNPPRFRSRPAPPGARRAYGGTPPGTPFPQVVAAPSNGKSDGELDGIRGARVLLVEDDVTNRTVGQRLLESLHCEVTVTCNGKEALEAMRGNLEEADPFSLAALTSDEELPPRFDLVLMDLLMPVMDGLRAVERFRDWEQDQKPRRKRMLIFALTGNVSDGDMVKCAQSGFDEFVSKPLTVDKLLHRLIGVCKTSDRFPGLRTSNFALPS